MSKLFEKTSIKTEILSGLTGAMLLGSYALCTVASAGLSIWNAFFCIAICSLFSIRLKNKIYAPDVFLLMPVLYIVSECGSFYLPVCIIGGVIICHVLSKAIKRNGRVRSIVAWATLALALVATIMLTNLYFGIGASGSTAIEMLKSYRSLGFHPHFRGLLYGTITLFAMITYPFKFKKLNKILPAEFITLLIPLILNLFLNPQKELTTINEIEGFSQFDLIYMNLFNFVGTVKLGNIPTLIIGCLFFGVVLYLRSSEENNLTNTFINSINGVFSFIPARQFDIISYSPLAAIITISVSGFVIFFFHDILSRIPMHCVGALLIVSAWQQVPYKHLRRARND